MRTIVHLVAENQAMNDTARSASGSAPVGISARRHRPLKNPTSYPMLAGVALQHRSKAIVLNPASQLAEQPVIRIRVCLQAYRNLPRMNPASASAVATCPEPTLQQPLQPQSGVRTRSRAQAVEMKVSSADYRAAGSALLYREPIAPASCEAAKRRKNAAHGASRGEEWKTDQPQRGERSTARPLYPPGWATI